MTNPQDSGLTSETGPSTNTEGAKAWQERTFDPMAAKRPERKPEFLTPSGSELDPIYGDAPDGGWPGEYPYTRGIQPTMYRGRFWTMRQYAGFSSAGETNRRFRMLLDNGQTGLSTAFDLPTQIGYDSDHPLAEPEVGQVGVPINSLKDVERLFEDIPLDEVSVSMTINATAPVLLGMVVALAKRRGIDPAKLRGTVQNDILKEYVARGNYRFPVGPSLRLTTDLMAYCQKNVPLWNTISISGYHIREAGSTAVQELAFTLANGKTYVKAAIDAGLQVDDFAPRLSFFFNAHNNLFEEVAKFRAARRMWARIMREEFGAKNPKSWMLRFHTQTAGSMLTSQQVDNNVVRVTIQALAAVLGGTQSLHT
ncbi:MAG: methylmalonyl-CoA mutase N-terminal domain/subunit, partial [Planctomycetota bacterium]